LPDGAERAARPLPNDKTIDVLGNLLFGLLGMAVLIAIATVFSSNRRAIDWRLVGTGLALQIGFALLLLKVPGGHQAFEALARGFVRLLGFVSVGSDFLFGSFVDYSKHGFTVALGVLPTIVFFASLTSVLYHLGIMQQVIKGMAWMIMRVMKLSGAETLSATANIFVGQTEAPLVVRPYLNRMTTSELFAVMVGGMATIAGGVMAAYIGMLGGDDPAAREFYATHLLTASLMAAPAALVIAKILQPEVGEPLTRGSVKMDVEKTSANVIDAAANGAAEGLKLALNIGAMLLAFVALIALLNAPLGWLGGLPIGDGSINAWLSEISGREMVLSLQTLLGFVLAPIAWIIGVPWSDAITVGGLIGQKVVINEFVSYADLSQQIDVLTPKGTLIATYALCGFANFSSIAIQIGGLGGMAPERREDIARLGLRAVLAGTIATLMTANIAGVISNL